MVNRYLDADVRVVSFLRFWAENASSNPPGGFFPAGSGFSAKTVNKRLFEKKKCLPPAKSRVFVL